MNAFVTLTHRSIEHTSPDAAGFVDGWWWTSTTDAGRFESGAATADAAEASARAYTERSMPGSDVIVFRAADLMGRAEDEARVAAAVAEWVTSRQQP